MRFGDALLGVFGDGLGQVFDRARFQFGRRIIGLEVAAEATDGSAAVAQAGYPSGQ
jgi:hypothetical protein